MVSLLKQIHTYWNTLLVKELFSLSLLYMFILILILNYLGYFGKWQNRYYAYISTTPDMHTFIPLKANGIFRCVIKFSFHPRLHQDKFSEFSLRMENEKAKLLMPLEVYQSWHVLVLYQQILPNGKKWCY